MSREPPKTAEGWYALHDFRTVDWERWRDSSERDRERTVDSGTAYLRRCEDVEDADEGASAAFSVLGHEADLLLIHLRPTMAQLEAVERSFERSEFAAVTERADSYVSVTEVSGYMSEKFFEEGAEIEDAGTARYIRTRLEPSIPDAEYASFYPMSKRRQQEYNWYDLPYEERAELMAGHGEIGKRFGGEITQLITGSVGLDDWEWGVTLFGDDPARIKRLVYEMRFDEASSKYADFGPFSVARRLPPAALGAFMAGEPYDVDAGADIRSDDATSTQSTAREELADLDVYAGQPHGEDVHAVVVYSEADDADLVEAVDGLRSNFEHYDTHVRTTVYENGDGGRAAVVSVWQTENAAETAGGFVADLPGVVGRDGGDDSTFGTMGMFYTVKPKHREPFLDRFEAVGELLDDLDGHLETDLLVNRDDENDMFIASRWESKADAMAFFRDEAFAETVDWGRNVLADRPRHVFLA